MYSDQDSEYYMIHNLQIWDSVTQLFTNNGMIEDNLYVGHTNTDIISSASAHHIKNMHHHGRLVKTATVLTATTGKYIFQIPFSNVLCDTSSGNITLLTSASSTNGHSGISWNFFKTNINNRVEIMRLLRNTARTLNKAVLVATHELDLALQTADVLWLASEHK
jgi:hypothetical protein